MYVFFAGGGTGGHLYPGLAIARALVRADGRVHPFFIGARRGIERDVLPESGFPFELLDLHPLYRAAPWHNWRTVAGGVTAWRRVSQLATQHRPAALVATGGYAAGVALGYASVHGIPIVIQEQNSFPGVTVRWFARRAAQIHLGFPEAAPLLGIGPATALFDSGNPIEPPPVSPPPSAEALAALGFGGPPRRTLLVFGGSQGAEALNRAVAGWLADGGAARAGVGVIWATGKRWYDAYRMAESELVRVRPYITPMADAYAAADFALCRAGAMTTAELAAWGIPAILVPLPTAAADHQTANARAIAAAGAARMIPQSELTPQALADAVTALAGDGALLGTMRDATLRRARPHAADDIAQHILSMKVFM